MPIARIAANLEAEMPGTLPANSSMQKFCYNSGFAVQLAIAMVAQCQNKGLRMRRRC
jgi:hypothetical protein